MAEEQKDPITDQEVKPITSEEQQKIDGTEGYDENIDSLDKWMNSLDAPETKEERAKRERKEKSKRVISAVSDGLSALSNLFFTTQYAPDMYEPRNSMTAATNAQIEKARAERERNADQYMNFALRLGDQKNARAKTIREIEAEQEKRKIAAQKAKDEHDKAEFEKTLQPFRTQEAKGKADKAESEALTAATTAKYAEKMEEAKIETEKARKGSYVASANASNASAAKSNLREFSAWDENGREHKFANKDAAERFAKQHGTWEETEIEETSVQDSELNGKTTTSKKSKGGHPGKPKRQSPTR